MLNFYNVIYFHIQVLSNTKKQHDYFNIATQVCSTAFSRKVIRTTEASALDIRKFYLILHHD